MINVLGRPGRRYLLLLLSICSFLILWHNHGFWILPPRFLSRSRTYTLDNGMRYVTGSYDWSRTREYYPAEVLDAAFYGPPNKLPTIQARATSETTDDVTSERRDKIKLAFVKSWNAYKKYAWKKDELVPLAGRGKKSLSGWSAQMVDALDTLWIMDLKDDFHIAVEHVATIDWSRTSDWSINVFEVTIRYLGGLLAAYDLSEEPALLAKATELGDTLYAAFDTPNRLPLHWLNYGNAVRGKQRADIKMSGAAGATLCLEFTRLGQLTRNPKYYDATARVKRFLHRWQPETKIPGLWPIMINWRDEIVDGTRFSIGAGMDSLYEYLPKMHAILGGLDEDYEDMTLRALDAIRDNILFKPMTPNDDNILMAGVAGSRKGKSPQLTADMQHLACFAGGMYGLAGKLFSRHDYVDLGTRLTNGCIWAYDAFPTGIMPEKAHMVACRDKDGSCPYRQLDTPDEVPGGYIRIMDSRYLLRPEAIESVFYMWRITGDQVWRDAAWRMWESIVAETETEAAFTSVADVTEVAGPMIDSMETFWMGETLKYFYLIFADESVINLDDWVLNTEAHPFKRPKTDVLNGL